MAASLIIDAARMKRTHDDLTYIGAILWLDVDGQPSIFCNWSIKNFCFQRFNISYDRKALW